VQEWSAAQDPAFTEGLAEVERLTGEAAPHGSVPPQPDTPELWSSFFRLQAAYLLLWSIVERYTALRFGPGLDPGVRVNMLGDDPSFLKAVADADVKPGRVTDSRDPSKHPSMAADGAGAAKYFYRIRSNLSHRGKSAFQDARLVHKAVTELFRAMQILLERQLPAANGKPEFRPLQPGGMQGRETRCPDLLTKGGEEASGRARLRGAAPGPSEPASVQTSWGGSATVQY
jgi:hypothetical protein